MSISRIFCLYIVLTILLLAATTATAQLKPLDELKGPIDQVIAILNDPKYKTDESLKAEQRDRIWESVESVFDFEEVSKRTLARHWRKFSQSQQEEFTDVFGRFLGNTYMDKIQGEYHNEKIVYGDQQIIDDKWAMVRTQIIRESLEIPVDYKMKLINSHWKIYDVVIEGVSLVKNYRIQFNSILRREKPAQLIERLKSKQIKAIE